VCPTSANVTTSLVSCMHILTKNHCSEEYLVCIVAIRLPAKLVSKIHSALKVSVNKAHPILNLGTRSTLVVFFFFAPVAITIGQERMGPEGIVSTVVKRQVLVPLSGIKIWLSHSCS
jgi:hypothetical protein